MKVVFSDEAWADYLWWQDQVGGAARVNRLIQECRRAPFTGLGKPEPLKRELAGYWSRRITGEHRLIYRVEGKGTEQRIELLACRLHYE